MLNLLSGSSQSGNSPDKALENNGLLSFSYSDSFEKVYSDFVITRQPPVKINTEKELLFGENANQLKGEGVFENPLGGKELPIWFSPESHNEHAQLPGFKSGPFTEQAFALADKKGAGLSENVFAPFKSSAKLENFFKNAGDGLQTSPGELNKNYNIFAIEEGNTRISSGELKVTSELLFSPREALSEQATLKESENFRAGEIREAWLSSKSPKLNNSSAMENVEKNLVAEGHQRVDVKTKSDKEASELLSNQLTKDKSGKSSEIDDLSGFKNDKVSLKKGEFLERNRQDAFAQKITELGKTSEPQKSEKQAVLDNLATLVKSGSLLHGQSSQQNAQAQNSVTQTSNYSTINQQVSGLHSSEPVAELKGTSSTDFNQGLNIKSRFAPDLSVRIQWMMRQSLSSAEILMDPPELGPMTVKVQQNNGELNLFFQVNNANTKDALDENMNRLKDLLEEQGLALGDTQVKQEENEASDSDSGEEEQTDSLLAQEDDENDSDKVTEHQLGLVDLYT